MPPKTLALWLAAILATYCHAIDIINGTEHSNGDIATGTTASASHNVKRTDLELNTEKGDPLCPLFTTLGSNQNENDLGRTLNIHMVPHTHDDVGWLKTVDQYYYGLNNT